MSRRYKVLVSIIAIVCSMLAASIGCGFVGGSDLTFPQRFLCNFVFSMQFLATVWCVIALFRKDSTK